MDTTDALWQRVVSLKSEVMRFATDDSGVTVVEYGLIVAMVSLMVVGAFSNFSQDIWTKMSTQIAGIFAGS